MLCKHCSTEIADKALICYRCGEPTTDARHKPAPLTRTRGRGSVVPALLGLIVLVLAALYMGQATTAGAPRIVAWVVVSCAALLLVWRLLRR